MSMTFYDYRKLYSHNATFNCVIGARGVGKTYGQKRDGVKDALTRGRQFIYLRRYYEELKPSKLTFFDDLIKNNEFPDWEFRVNGPIAQAATKASADDKKRNWITIGFFVALSQAQATKSVSYANVYRIIFDEFIAEAGVTYLPDEARAFQQFYFTVNRGREGEDRAKAYLLANAVSIANPYFVRWKIRVPKDTEIVRYSKNSKTGRHFIAVHFPKANDFMTEMANTEFGAFLLDTDPEYAAFAMKNEFKDNNGAMVMKKDSAANYRYTLKTASGDIAVWYSPVTKYYYATEHAPPEANQRFFTLEVRYMDKGIPYLEKSDQLIAFLRTAWRRGRVMFDSDASKAAFLESFG